MKRISIYGASGCGNVGDDILGITLREMLRRHIPYSEVTMYQQHIRDDIERSDIVVVGGGGLIYDYDFENVRNYCDITIRAGAQLIPVFWAGMGVQHVFSQEAIDYYKNALQFVHAVSVRNDEDGKFFTDVLGYDPSKLIVSRDLAFLSKDVFGVQWSKPPLEKKRLVVALADWKLSSSNYEKIDKGLAQTQTRYLEYLHQRLGTLTDQYDVQLVAQSREDLSLYKELVREHPAVQLVTFDDVEKSADLLRVYGEADVAITGRYHGLIAGLVTGTPTIGVSFSGHKQQKLVNDTFPSLKRQYYTIDRMLSEDIFAKLLNPDFVRSLRRPRMFEKMKCQRLAQKNYQIAKMIAGELAKS